MRLDTYINRTEYKVIAVNGEYIKDSTIPPFKSLSEAWDCKIKLIADNPYNDTFIIVKITREEV